MLPSVVFSRICLMHHQSGVDEVHLCKRGRVRSHQTQGVSQVEASSGICGNYVGVSVRVRSADGKPRVT